MHWGQAETDTHLSKSMLLNCYSAHQLTVLYSKEILSNKFIWRPTGFKRKIKKILNWLSDRWSPGCRAFDDWTVKYVLIYCLSYANFYFQYCRKISQRNCKLCVLGKYQCYIETQSHVAEIHFQFDI